MGWHYLVWLACQPPEGRGKDGPAGLGWTLKQALEHSPQHLEFVLADHGLIKALTRRVLHDVDVADGKLADTIKSEYHAHMREKRKFYTGSEKSPLE